MSLFFSWLFSIDTGAGQPVLIAHNYGHGGAGYQSSWGTAYHLLRLIEQAQQDDSLVDHPLERSKL